MYTLLFASDHGLYRQQHADIYKLDARKIVGGYEVIFTSVEHSKVMSSPYEPVDDYTICFGENCDRKNVSVSYNISTSSNETGNGTDGNDTYQAPLSHESQLGLIVLYSSTAVLSIVGNMFVILVFARGRRSRTDLRPFLINLAVADLIMAVFCIPFTFTQVMLGTWIFSIPLCPVVLFMQVFSVAGSVFTNMAIGIDRFVVVTFPLRSRLTSARAKYVIVAIWMCALALSSVQFFVGKVKSYDDGTFECGEFWSDTDMGSRRLYGLFILILTYLIPLFILVVTYSIVACVLWKRTAPGNADQVRDLHQLKSKRKVVKMLVIVVAMFGICWLPIHSFILIIDFNPEIHSYVPPKTLIGVYLSVHWFAMANSFANPIIYGFTNESFRADLVTLLAMWFPCCVFIKKMMPRKYSSTTYESVIFRRQSLGLQRQTTLTLTLRSSKPNKQSKNTKRAVQNGHSRRYMELDMHVRDNAIENYLDRQNQISNSYIPPDSPVS